MAGAALDELAAPLRRRAAAAQLDAHDEPESSMPPEAASWKVLLAALLAAKQWMAPVPEVFVAEPRAAGAVFRAIREAPEVAGNCEHFLVQHALQVESLVRQAECLGPFDAICEIGAGKGLLARCLKEFQGPRVDLVTIDCRECRSFVNAGTAAPLSAGAGGAESEGAGGIGTTEHFVLDAVRAEGEAAALLRRLAAGGQPGAAGSPHRRRRVLAIAKHLCAGATDAALRALGVEADCALVAPCCHTKLDMKDYCNPSFLRDDLGIPDASWPLLLKTIHLSKASKDFSGTGVGSSALRDFARWRRWEAQLGTTWRELGWLARRALEEGRARYLRSLGFEVDIIRYVPPGATPDNLLLRARRSLGPAPCLTPCWTDKPPSTPSFFGFQGCVVLHTQFDAGSAKGSSLAQRVCQYLLERRAESFLRAAGCPAEAVVTSAIADGVVWVLTSGALEPLFAWLSEDCALLAELGVVDAVYPFDRCLTSLADAGLRGAGGPWRLAVWPRERFAEVGDLLEALPEMSAAKWSPQHFRSTLSIVALPEAAGFGVSQLPRAIFDPCDVWQRGSRPAGVEPATAELASPEARRVHKRWSEWRLRLGLAACLRVLTFGVQGKRFEAWRLALRVAQVACSTLEDLAAPGQLHSERAVCVVDCTSNGDLASAITSALDAAQALDFDIVLVAVNLETSLAAARATSGGPRKRRDTLDAISREARARGWQLVLHHMMTDRELERTAVCRRRRAS